MNDRLFTWLDVNHRIRQYINSVKDVSIALKGKCLRAYWDGLHITLLNGEVEEIIHLLEDIFLASFDRNKMVIYLGQAPTIELPVIFEEEVEEYIAKETFLPEFNPLPYVGESLPYIEKREIIQNEPVVIGFHSFKGGVGRTLHAVALALELSSEGKKVLLIDADFEAPGISWYFENTDIAFSDFIAMAHGDKTKKFHYTLSNTSKILQNSNYENIYILPAFRDNVKFGEPTIKPEHLNNVTNPFLVQDLVLKLGAEMGVDYIILDLRAGLSELSSGWLLDPKVLKVYTTTLSGQSLRGCQNLLERSAIVYDKFKLDKHSNNFLPFILFTQIPIGQLENNAKAEWDSNIEERIGEWLDLASLKRTYVNLAPKIEDDNYPFWIENACFSSENNALKILPHYWDELVRIVRDSGLLDKIRPLREWLPDRQPEHKSNKFENSENEDIDLDAQRRQISNMANELIYAESTSLSSSDLLITQSIESLAARNVANVPIVVIVGAKGSGKTYLFRHMSIFRTWREFIERVRGTGSGGPNAQILQATLPVNLPGNHKTNGIKDLLSDWLSIGNWSETQWRDKWLDIISWISGAEPLGKENVGQGFAKNATKDFIFLFDGLEEIFLEYYNKDSHKIALRALLQGVPNWLEALPRKNIGVVIFIRQDIVSYVIPQNTGQFLSRYQSYQLKWNEEEALRMAHWVAKKSDVLPNSQDSTKMGRVELEDALHRIWGQRLGKDNSREAKSANWILDALSNLQNEVQSRDIVRFLHFAAEASLNDVTKKYYTDRLLTPTSIRKGALSKVGSEKLDELRAENKLLYDVLVQIRDSGLKFPCAKKDLDDTLKFEQRDMMEKNGALKEHKNEYYLAEIWRRGLGIGYSKIGKPKTQW